MRQPTKPTRAQKSIIEESGYDSTCYSVLYDRNGLLCIVSRSDDRNIIRIDRNTKKRIPG